MPIPPVPAVMFPVLMEEIVMGLRGSHAMQGGASLATKLNRIKFNKRFVVEDIEFCSAHRDPPFLNYSKRFND